MKKALLFLTFLWFVACQNDALTLESEGIITQRDYRKCYCCGGWLIEIEGKTWLADLSPEQIESLGLDETAVPMPVQLDWKKEDKACLDNKILVAQIKRR
ncbi:MAG: hypothetical protein SFU99_14420 [Saprospiraceae bacterium]|nr:hypothetical protein [Saprospiraceae bacterium]